MELFVQTGGGYHVGSYVYVAIWGPYDVLAFLGASWDDAFESYSCTSSEDLHAHAGVQSLGLYR